MAAPAKDDPALIQQAAERGIAGTPTALPHGETIQRAFGRHDVSHVRAHVDESAASASRAIGAEAYATGDEIAFAGAPSLHTAAHEAAHVIQQRAGVHAAGGVGGARDEHEDHADSVADAVVRGESAEGLLDRYAGSTIGAAVQRKFRVGKTTYGSKDFDTAKEEASAAGLQNGVVWTKTHDRILREWLGDDFDMGDVGTWTDVAKSIDAEAKLTTSKMTKEEKQTQEPKDKPPSSLDLWPGSTEPKDKPPSSLDLWPGSTEPKDKKQPKKSKEEKLHPADVKIRQIKEQHKYMLYEGWEIWGAQNPPEQGISESHGDIDNTPIHQGWKLHIGAKPEYLDAILEACTATLRNLDISHKMVPSLLKFSTMKNTQVGKAITIYPYDIGSFEAFATIVLALDAMIAELLSQHQEWEPPDVPPSELPVGGTGFITTRYAGLNTEFVVDPKTRKRSKDDRSKIMPDFVKEVPQPIWELVPEHRRDEIRQKLVTKNQEKEKKKKEKEKVSTPKLSLNEEQVDEKLVDEKLEGGPKITITCGGGDPVIATQFPFIIGRGVGKGVVANYKIKNQTVSAKHLTITLGHEGFYVDCQGTNGTTCNGKDVNNKRIHVTSGDVFYLGPPNEGTEVKLTF